jgi:hypothetical protein
MNLRPEAPIEIDDPGIQEMSRMELAEYRAVQALIGPYGAEFSAAEHGTFPLGTSIRRTPPPLMPPSGPSQPSG